ncbi:hypothetical protein AA0243_1883 [Novacetimonas hansenii NRIC 0243]|nr:hypothetical protein AA0243_1883 [Novacetimonas hansenii NRIC 0243]
MAYTGGTFDLADTFFPFQQGRKHKQPLWLGKKAQTVGQKFSSLPRAGEPVYYRIHDQLP